MNHARAQGRRRDFWLESQYSTASTELAGNYRRMAYKIARAGELVEMEKLSLAASSSRSLR